MTSCSVCKQPMSEYTGAKISVGAPEVGKSLVFTLCVLCRDKAKDHRVDICLNCGAVVLVKADATVLDRVTEGGISYTVKAQCSWCVAESVLSGFKWVADFKDGKNK